MSTAMSAPRMSASPSFEEDRALSRYARAQDPRDLETLVLRYRPLAVGLARRYAGGGYGIEDLEQVACIGLIKALKRFDPDRGCTFKTFAVPTILGELRRFCRDTAWSAHVPRGMQEGIAAVRRAGDDAATRLGRTPTAADIANALDWPVERVLEALVAGSTRATVPLEQETDGWADAASLLDRLGGPDPAFERVECLSALEKSMPALSRAENQVLRLRFEEDLKIHAIARRLELSESHVSRLLASAIATLRRQVGVTAEEPPRAHLRTTFGTHRREERRRGLARQQSRPRKQIAMAS